MTESTRLNKLIEVLGRSVPSFEAGETLYAERILDCNCELGETILYDDSKNSILWTDIYGRKFHCLDLSVGSHTVKDLPKMLCSFALRADNEIGYLCAWEDGFQLYDIENLKALSEMSSGEEVNPTGLPTRMNDGRTDPDGKRFIVGGYYGEIEDMYMKVYKCELQEDASSTAAPALKHSALVDKIQVTNSICFSTDGDTMYLADSPTREICKYKYDRETGALSEKQTLRTLDIGVPDGSCVDSNGNLWNAIWRSGAGPGMVNCINSQTGDIISTVHMPDGTSQITCCCFGGPNLDILFISSAAERADKVKEPHAGCVYAAKVGVQGCPEVRFVGY
mmetsp:Transcript_4965/g.5768  ORF Transcript_4965/g.5768 Transcript_4965/m.5768 type:complete len:336 (+) Transcript_4965:59-1066(+)